MGYWDEFMDVLRIIIPVITFILGYVLSSLGQKREWERKSKKELFGNFYIKFMQPYVNLCESAAMLEYSNYSDDEKDRIKKLLYDYELLLPSNIQQSIYAFRMTLFTFEDDSSRINSSYENLFSVIVSEYKLLAELLGYQASARLK